MKEMYMFKFFRKYPIAVLFVLSWFALNAWYMDEAHSYCKTTYTGTVTGKSETPGKYLGDCYLEIAFDSIPTQVLMVHPITYSKYAIGDRFYTKSDFHILGASYTPKDPKYKILNQVAFALCHTVLIFVLGAVLVYYLIFGLYGLNKKISEHLRKA